MGKDTIPKNRSCLEWRKIVYKTVRTTERQLNENRTYEGQEDVAGEACRKHKIIIKGGRGAGLSGLKHLFRWYSGMGAPGKSAKACFTKVRKGSKREQKKGSQH